MLEDDVYNSNFYNRLKYDSNTDVTAAKPRAMYTSGNGTYNSGIGRGGTPFNPLVSAERVISLLACLLIQCLATNIVFIPK